MNFKNIVCRGIDTNFKELKEERKRKLEDEKREKLIHRNSGNLDLP